MNLTEHFIECVGSGNPLVIVRTDESDDVESTVTNVCRGNDFDWSMWVWDVDTGLASADGEAQKVLAVLAAQNAPKPPTVPPGVSASAAAVLASLPPQQRQQKTRPHDGLIAALKTLDKVNNEDKDEETGVTERRAIILVVRNIHKLWREGDQEQVLAVIQLIQNCVKRWKITGKMLLGLTVPGEMPPPELLPLTTIIDHSLPKKEEFKAVVDNVELSQTGVQLSDADIELVAEGSCGLTRLQAENCYAVAALRYTKVVEIETETAKKEKRSVTPAKLLNVFLDVVEEKKNDILNADALLKRWNGPEDFDSIGGNDAAKAYLRQLMNPEVRRRGAGKNPRLNAVTMIGPSGTGKTLLAKALGRFTGRKTYGANLSSQKSKWVGESEANARRMFERASAMSNIILYFDEFNEQIEGGDGGGDGHSVDKALRQYLMEWLDTHYRTDDVFVVLTANMISGQHMGLYRRLGKIFYVGHPGKTQKQQIWSICINKHELEEKQFEKLPDDQGWVGEDIDACCAFASALQITVVEAARAHVIPSSDYTSAAVEALKNQANGICFDAETGEKFRKDKILLPDPTGSLDGLKIRRKIRKTP